MEFGDNCHVFLVQLLLLFENSRDILWNRRYVTNWQSIRETKLFFQQMELHFHRKLVLPRNFKWKFFHIFSYVFGRMISDIVCIFDFLTTKIWFLQNELAGLGGDIGFIKNEFDIQVNIPLPNEMVSISSNSLYF